MKSTNMNSNTITMQQINTERCERISIEEWAGWFEGEEGWGCDDDD